MSDVHLIILQKEYLKRSRDAIHVAEATLNRILAIGGASTRIKLNNEIFDIESNTKIRDHCHADWVIESNEYLWITTAGVGGGIDIECEDVSKEELEFLSNDMVARSTDPRKRRDAVRRAEGGMVYSARLSAGQPSVQRILHVALSASMASTCRGFIYTLDAGWLAPLVPLFDEELGVLLHNEDVRKRTGLQEIVEEARRQLRER